MLWTSVDTIKATGGTCAQSWGATGVSIDTRTILPGDLFVALAAERDGHDFVQMALDKGAAAALVSHIPDGVAKDAPLLLVDDVLVALEAMAVFARNRTDAQIIAVTGSVGKTSTKDMLRVILDGFGRVHAAEKSYNNHWGVPLTLVRMPKETDYAVIEIGMNHAGEIGPLSRMTNPDVAIVTTVAEVHLEAFKSVKEIAKAKAEIFEGLKKGGTAVLNRDIPTYPILMYAAKKSDVILKRFGYFGRPEMSMKRVTIDEGSTNAMARHNYKKLKFTINAMGKHYAMNALSALLACEAVGIDPQKAAKRLARWQSTAGRGAKWTVAMKGGELSLFDESYNANPTSVAAALEVLSPSDAKDGNRVAFLGDMMELGPNADQMHVDLAQLESINKIDKLHLIGPHMMKLHHALPDHIKGEWANSSAEMLEKLPQLIKAGDLISVKGSLSLKMSILVDAILKMGDATIK